MRRIDRIITLPAAVVALAGGVMLYRRRNPRVGTAFVNSVVNPQLLRRGLVGGGVSELGTIEHVGRRSGIRRLTPVHPEPTSDGFRIVVPLGEHSEWAHNVMAAGYCRLQVHDHVYALDEPTLIRASDVDDLPRAVRGVMGALGFEYLKLRTFSASPGTLEPVGIETVEPVRPATGQTTEADLSGELVTSH